MYKYCKSYKSFLKIVNNTCVNQIIKFYLQEFQTPEEFFKGEKAAPFKWGSLNPTEFVKTCPKDTDDTVYHSKVS